MSFTRYAVYAAILFAGMVIGDSTSLADRQSVETGKPKSEYRQLAQKQLSDAKLIKNGIKFARRKRKLNSGNVVVADEAYIRRSIFDPRAEVVKGYPRSLMPKGLRQKLSDEQVEAIIVLIKSIR